MGSRLTAVVAVLFVALCLPEGVLAAPTVYPEGVTIHEEGVADGYVLFGAPDTVVYLVDVEGTVVHTWSFPCGWASAIKPLENGHVLSKSCVDLVELDWDGTVVWELNPPGGAIFHHDWVRLQNGNTLALCRRNINDPAISDKTIREDYILEFSPSGEVVWEWYEADHFDEFGFSQERKDLIYQLGGDWSHANSIDPIPDNTSHADPGFIPGNVIISIRHQNTIAVIDRVTGEVVWAISDSVIGQHSAYMLPDDVPGGGNILSFDNGYAREFSLVPNRYYSRVVEIDPVTDSSPYAYTAEDSGLRLGTFFAGAKSGAQRLANGNTFVTEALRGRLFEVTDSGQIVWEYVIPYKNVQGSNGTYRAYKVPIDWAAPYFVPDLVVTGDDDPDPVQAGGLLEYAILVQNTGSDPAVNAELSAATPPGTTFESILVPDGWDCSTPPVDGTGSIVCTNPSLGAAKGALFAIVVRVDSCEVGETPIACTAVVSSDGTDGTPGDNSTTIETTATCQSTGGSFR